VLIVHNRGRTDVLFLEFALALGSTVPSKTGIFCTYDVQVVLSPVKQEILRFTVEVISGILVFWRGFSVFPVLVKL
jgi:hypothetical protein